MSDNAPFQETLHFLKVQYPHPIQAVAILGSGLGELVGSLILNATVVPFSEIPHFPHSTVEGHHGAVHFGELKPGFHIAFLQGRVHFYEGHTMAKVVYPLRSLKQLGAHTLLVTNAAGGVNPSFSAGDLMLIEDHINLMGANPLIGKNNPQFGPRFPDMSEAYTPQLRELVLEKALQHNIFLQKGVYCAMSGPSYETPAEIRMIRTLGADAVGMSTVPEVIVASHMGMQVIGISCITNAAAGVVQGHRLNHEEVLEAAEQAKTKFSRLVEAVLLDLPVPSEAGV